MPRSLEGLMGPVQAAAGMLTGTSWYGSMVS